MYKMCIYNRKPDAEYEVTGEHGDQRGGGTEARNTTPETQEKKTQISLLR